MGVVWKAYDSVIRRYVALKILSDAVARSQDARHHFLREARAAGALQHSAIVTIYDLGEADGQLFIAMELVDGRDLSSMIATREPLALERKLDIVIEVLQGLAYAHGRGVIHRDVKPSNVRVASDGSVKIMDFGIARLQSADVTGSGAIVGTPTYMAPEQITNGAITPATDLYAVGCLLYELLCYRKPFEGETVHGVLYQVLTTYPKPLRTMAPSIPAALERVVSKALDKAPGVPSGPRRGDSCPIHGSRGAARPSRRWRSSPRRSSTYRAPRRARPCLPRRERPGSPPPPPTPVHSTSSSPPGSPAGSTRLSSPSATRRSPRATGPRVRAR